MVNNCSMTVNYSGILTLEIIVFFTTVIYHGKFLRYFYNIGPRQHNLVADLSQLVGDQIYQLYWSSRPLDHASLKSRNGQTILFVSF